MGTRKRISVNNYNWLKKDADFFLTAESPALELSLKASVSGFAAAFNHFCFIFMDAYQKQIPFGAEANPS